MSKSRQQSESHHRHALGAVVVLAASVAVGCASTTPPVATAAPPAPQASAPKSVSSSREPAPAPSESPPSQPAPEASPPQLVRHSLMSPATHRSRDYFVYLPRGYEDYENKQWPTIVFLHGHGERGDGKEELGWVMSHGPLYEAWILKRDLPFILVVPQLPMFDMKTSAPYLEFRDQSKMPRRLPGPPPERKSEFETSQPMTGAVPENELPYGEEGPPSGWSDYRHELVEMTMFVQSSYRSDRSRLYLTGLSYGGYGTWWLGAKCPQMFAAIAPVVGWGHPDLMPALADPPMPIWAFAGGRDSAVRTKHFFAGINELERLGHPDVRFTIHEDMGHDVWKRVYGGQDIYDWFLQHRKNSKSDRSPEPSAN